MIGSLLDRWEYAWADIWEPLGNDPDAPEDLFIELYRAAMDHFRRRLPFDRHAEIVSNPKKAYEAFQNIKGKDFKSEVEIVTFFEEAFETLNEFGINSLAAKYADLVDSFISRYNLRYRLVKPFTLLVQLPWLYADIYKELNQLDQQDSHLMDLMNDFEYAFDVFARTRTRRDLQTSIAKASNYAEGVAAAALRSPGETLGRMCDQLLIWPHEALKESIKNLYRFCSDYPGIRHAGNPASKLRKLNAKDTIIISALLIAFSGYIQGEININKILSR
jgi:hypothetical protein